MSALTDRLYAQWLVANGSRDLLHLARARSGAKRIGAQRRGRPEGYPKDQGRPAEGRRPDGKAPAGPQGGSALQRSDAGRGSQLASLGGGAPSEANAQKGGNTG